MHNICIFKKRCNLVETFKQRDMKRVELINHLETSIYKKLFYNGIDVFMLDDNSRLISKDGISIKLKPTTPYVVVKNSIEETFKVKL